MTDQTLATEEDPPGPGRLPDGVHGALPVRSVNGGFRSSGLILQTRCQSPT